MGMKRVDRLFDFFKGQAFSGIDQLRINTKGA
jgi:hypothetical protein